MTDLEQAISNYQTPIGSVSDLVQAIEHRAFKAGAEWQKKRYKELIRLAELAANTCENEGNMSTAFALKNELERLQD